MFFFSAIQNGFDGEKALYNVPKCLQICWIFDLKGGFPSLSFFSRIHTHANIELTYIQNYKILKTRLYPLNIWWRKNCNEIYTTEHSARKLRPIAFGVFFFLLLFITFDRAQLVARLTCGHSAYIITQKNNMWTNAKCKWLLKFLFFIV